MAEWAAVCDIVELFDVHTTHFECVIWEIYWVTVDLCRPFNNKS